MSKTRLAWYKNVSGLLPGDHIHFVAPSNRPQAFSTADALAVKDAAARKRARKLERNRKLAQS